MTFVRVFLIVLSAIMLSGCVTQATYDGRKFGTPAEALSYQVSKYDEAIRGIEPLNEPILENGAFFAASRTLIDKYNRQQNPNLQQWQYNYFSSIVENDGKKIYESLKRKNIFGNLTFIESDGLKPDISEYDAAVYMYWPELSTIGYFFASPTIQHEPVPISKGYITWGERIERWLINVQALSQVH